MKTEHYIIIAAALVVIVCFYIWVNKDKDSKLTKSGIEAKKHDKPQGTVSIGGSVFDSDVIVNSTVNDKK